VIVYQVIDGVVHHLFIRNCPDGAGVVRPEVAWVPQVSVAELRAQAYDSVTRQLPAPQASFAPPAGKAVAQVGTWFWVGAAQWQPVTATAAVPGLSATVTAVPVALRLDPGDGPHGTGPVSCGGPGQVWTAADGDDAVSACQYTYRHSSALSPTGTWRASVSIDWQVTFTASDGSASDLGRLVTSTPYELRVGELQAVVVG
jgi:hypothetical protein